MATYVDYGLTGLFAVTVSLILVKGLELWCPRAMFSRSFHETAGDTRVGLDRAVRKFERGMTFLGQIVQVAPFIGLAGTVMHIIEALQRLQGAGADVSLLYSSLAFALYSTLWGLASAIPATFFHGMFRARVEELAVEVLESHGESEQTE